MKNRPFWPLILAWNSLLLLVILCAPIPAFAAEQPSSVTDAFTGGTLDETSTEALSEEEQVNIIAEELHQKAESAEPAVTAFLKTMESEHGRLEGLEYRVKTLSSLARKLMLLAHENNETLTEAKSEIRDVLRYTLIIEDPYYVGETIRVLDSLMEKGYALISFRNYWANDEKAYQGINCNFACEDGTIFELQFHTPLSYETKSVKTHQYYEIMRDENAPEAEREEARQKHDALYKLIPVPDGVRELSYDEQERITETEEAVEDALMDAE